MIFSIVWSSPEECLLDEEKLTALENLLTAHRERNHVVFFPRKIIKKILDCNVLSKVSQNSALEVLNTSREYKQLCEKFSLIVYIDFDKIDYIKNNNNEGRHIIEISYDYFITSSRTQLSTLIPENDVDFELYKIIGESYLKNHIEHKLNISFNKHCGYGSHTHRVYSQYRNDNKFALCIVDNDRKYPDAALGSTASSFHSNDFSIVGTVEAAILNVREAESLIPISIVEETIVDGDYPNSKVDVVDKIKLLDTGSRGEFRRYFDHKEGITLKEAIKPNAIRFWKGFFSSEKLINIKSCYQTNECNECGSCIALEGLGDKILDNTLEVLNKKNRRNLMKNLSQELHREWHYIGEKIVAWGCVPEPRRVRAN